MQPSGGSRKPTPPPPALASSGAPPSSSGRGVGGVFDDYSFRFSKTYTAVDGHSKTTVGTPKLSSGAYTNSAGSTKLGHIGPRSMLAPPPSTVPSTNTTSATTVAAGASQDGATARAGGRLANGRSGPSGSAASGRAAVDQEAATRVMSLLSHRKPIPSPGPQHFRTAARAKAAAGLGMASHHPPATHPLPPPVLGEAAGAVYMGTHAAQLSLTADERTQVMNEALDDEGLLFAAWRHRQQARLDAGRRRTVEAQLEHALAEATYGLLVDEEDFWIQELSHSQMKGRELSVNPKLKPYGTGSRAHLAAGDGCGQDMMAHNNGLSTVGATSRGITVPLSFMESLFKGLRALLHQRTVALLTSMRASKEVRLEATCDSDEKAQASDVDTSSREETVKTELLQRAEAAEEDYIQALVASETALGKHAVQEADDSSSGGLLPSTISLPPERIVGPVLSLETATSAVLLWKVLEQAQTVIPHMHFAVTLYVHYILPHLYEHFSLHALAQPRQTGSLSEQVRQLTTYPLRVRSDLAAHAALEQATQDVAYMETAMKTWALRTWRATVLSARRERRQREALEAAMAGLRRRMRVRQVFDAWRLVARETAQQTYMANIESEYRAFRQSSAVAAQVERFPLLGADASGKAGRGSHGGTAYNRAKFLATALAESAAHDTSSKRRGDSPRRSPTSSSSPPLRLPPVMAAETGRTNDAAPRPAPAERAAADDVPTLPSAPAIAVKPVFALSSDGASRARDDLPVGNESGYAVHAFQATATTTFDAMLCKLREMEEVCGHLQSEIAIQNGRVAKLEREKASLTDRNRTLEAKLLDALADKLRYCTIVQEKQLRLNDRDRRIAQLKSRLRAHRHRPWQKTVLRLMGTVCGASTQLSEAADEARLLRAAVTPGVGADGAATVDERNSPGTNASAANGGGTSAVAPESGEAAFAAQRAEEKEEQRLFGRLAPIVLSSTQNMPDALVILQDWANACLDDLESLDDIKGGALSLRVTTFSEELRNGVLLSRLLYYLALPRYLHSSDASATSGGREEEESSGHDGERRRQRGSAAVRRELMAAAMGRADKDGVAEDMFAPNVSERRSQLLEKRRVQLETPFPVYSDCFGDLLNMRVSDRMTVLLQFATELVIGQEAPPSEAVEAVRANLRHVLHTTLGLAEPLPAGRLELTEVIDPHALAMGERSAGVTLIALLYTRFAHPFNHKCKQSAVVERAGILYLLSGGQWVQEEECARRHVSGAASSTSIAGQRSTSLQHVAPLSTVEQELLACLDDEDKSPWQLFKERCLPVFGTAAHPFLLRGNFWPSDAFDSPDLAELLGELGMALNRSLEMHRWHVTLSCLVPVLTYSGLSRGVFTGPRTSPTALRVGLERESQWEFPLGYAHLERIFSRRVGLIQRAVVDGRLDLTEVLSAPSWESQGAALYYGSPASSSHAEAGSGRARGLSESRSDAHHAGYTTHGEAGEDDSADVAATTSAAPPRRASRSSFFIQPSTTRRDTTVGGAGAESTTPASVLEGIHSRERAALMSSLQVVLDDMLSFFASRATLNAELALPVLDLQGWRMLCADMKLLSVPHKAGAAAMGASGHAGVEGEDGAVPSDNRQDASRPQKLLSMEAATQIFHLAILSYLDLDVDADGAALSVPPTANSSPSKGTATASSAGLVSMVQTSPASSGVVPLPTVRSYMTFPAFAMALVLVADELYPDVLVVAPEDGYGADDTTNPTAVPESLTVGSTSQPVAAEPSSALTGGSAHKVDGFAQGGVVRWLGDALTHLVQSDMVAHVVVDDSSPGALFDDPRSVILRLTSGLRTQETLNWYSPCIVAVYNAYSRELFGLSVLQCDDVMRLLRDAMLTSTEISQYLITELFQHCAVTHSAQDEAIIAKRREIDGKPRTSSTAPAGGNEKRKGGRSVRIVDPHSSTAATPSTEVKVLHYDGFVQLLCVLCVFKQPNPLVAFDQRLGVFLRRSLLRPLTHKVDGLSMLLNRSKMPARGAPVALDDGNGLVDAQTA